MSNSEALLNAGDMSLADYLFVLNRMLADSHPLVFLPALESLKLIGDEFIDENNSDLFAQFVDQALTERFEVVGAATADSDSEATIQMRPRLLRVLVQYGSNPSAQIAAEEVALKYLEDPASHRCHPRRHLPARNPPGGHGSGEKGCAQLCDRRRASP